MLIDWANVTVGSLEGLWGDLLAFLPSLIGAIVVLIVGLIVASVIARIIEHIIGYLKIDTLLRKADVEEYFKRAGMSVNTGHFLGRLTYWFIVIAFLLAASDILNFVAFSQFLGVILAFIPKVIIAALILLATMVAAHFLRRLVVASIASAKLHHAKSLGLIVWWIVFIFGLLAAFEQIGINVAIINTLITGLIAMLAIAGGLAFGLGGKEQASRFLSKMSDQIKS